MERLPTPNPNPAAGSRAAAARRQRRSAAAVAGGGAGGPRLRSQAAWIASLQASPALVAQRRRLHTLAGGTAGVMQLGAKYEHVYASAKDDADERFDYAYSSVSEQDYVDAADELIAEHLAAGYKGHDDQDVAVPKATPSSGGWGGAPGMVMIPVRDKGLNQMMGTNTFVASINHELGHFAVEGRGAHQGMKAAIQPLAAKAGVAADLPEYADAKPKKDAWVEEARADLTGVHLRTVRDKAKPAISEYESQLGDEPADGEHPPGKLRVSLIREFLEKP